jgi:hypothetical protein
MTSINLNYIRYCSFAQHRKGNLFICFGALSVTEIYLLRNFICYGTLSVTELYLLRNFISHGTLSVTELNLLRTFICYGITWSRVFHFKLNS